MYIIYNNDTRRIERIDTNAIVPDEGYTMIEKDITLEDDICMKMNIYKVDENEEFYVDEELVKEHNLNILRAKREPLLKAFDIYKSNLIVGAITLHEDEKQQVITWYNLILDLDEDAINNPPQVILRYL